MDNHNIPVSEPGAHLILRAAELRSKTVNVRLARADILIAEARTVMGYGDGVVEKMLNAAFPGGSPEYWSVQLSEPMLVRSFVHLLHRHQMGPADPRQYGPFNTQTMIEFALDGALRRAFDANEPFFIGNGLIEPRGAVEWIHSKPRWREYLPASLVAYLNGGANDKSILSAPRQPPTIKYEPSGPQIEAPRKHDGASPRKRGPKADVGPRVEAAMREMDRAELSDMKYEAMRVTFAAAPSTCAGIRKKVLSEIVGN